MLLSPYTLGPATLNNHVVMAPMTRNRAINNIPNELMAKYYSQRSSAGLIITEGVSPSPNGLGYARMPGIFSKKQIDGWKLVASAVHAKGGKIFMQLMHTGRVGHPLNLPAGAKILGPSFMRIPGEIWTDQQGMQLYGNVRAMDAIEISEAKEEFVLAARNAIEAGFDGIELHAANGYLLEQFLSPHTNRRDDEYGGTVQNRSRLILEIAEAVSLAIGKHRTGIRLSPYGTVNDMPHYDDINETYTYLVKELAKLELVYLHLIDIKSAVSVKLKEQIRLNFSNALILSGGYTHAKANEDLASGKGDLISFGKPFISNPDLVERLHKNFPLNFMLDVRNFSSPGPKGFIDYPLFDEEFVTV